MARRKSEWKEMLSFNLIVTKYDISQVFGHIGKMDWCDSDFLHRNFYKVTDGKPILIHDNEDGRDYELTMEKMAETIIEYAQHPSCSSILLFEGDRFVIDLRFLTDEIGQAILQKALFGRLRYPI